MPTIYKHQRPNNQVLNFAFERKREIKEAIEQLQLEDALMQRIIDQFDPLVCPTCKGAGYVMAPIPGCECDGPRQHMCITCSGNGATRSQQED